jgi:hypothetical protein
MDISILHFEKGVQSRVKNSGYDLALLERGYKRPSIRFKSEETLKWIIRINVCVRASRQHYSIVRIGFYFVNNIPALIGSI